jgi:hypothetical protein
MTSTTFSPNARSQALHAWKWQMKSTMGLFWVYTSILLLFFPILSIFIFYNTNNIEAASSYTQGVLSSLTIFLGMPLLLLFSVLFTFSNFGFLHKRRQLDLFHAMPISRTSLFAGKFLAGITSLFLPLAVSVILVTPVVMSRGWYTGAFSMNTLQVLGILLLFTLEHYAFTVFLAVCSGSILDTVISYLLISVSWPAIILCGVSIIYETIPGIQTSLQLNILSAFSPPLAAMVGIWSQTDPSLPYNFQVLPFYLWNILLMVVLILAGGIFYKKRKSEDAESTAAYGPSKIAIRILSCTAGSLVFGSLVYIVTRSSISFYVSVFVVSIVAYLVTELLYHHTLQELKKHLVPYTAVFLALVLFFTSCSFGLFGMDTWLPAKEDVAYVSTYNNIPSGGYSVTTDLNWQENTVDPLKMSDVVLAPGCSSDEMKEKALEISRNYLSLIREYQFPYLMGTPSPSNRDISTIWRETSYVPKEGNAVLKNYNIPIDLTETEVFQTSEKLRQEIAYSQEYLSGILPINAYEAASDIFFYGEEYETLQISSQKDPEALRKQLRDSILEDLSDPAVIEALENPNSEDQYADTKDREFDFEIQYSDTIPFTASGGFMNGKPAEGEKLLLVYIQGFSVNPTMKRTYALLEDLFSRQ